MKHRSYLIALAVPVILHGFAPVNAQIAPAGGPAGALGGLQPGLGTLPLLGQGRTRSVTAENPTGEKGKGGMAIPNPSEPKPAAGARAADDLGQGWKVRPFLRINAGETATLMDVKGPGIIQHMWLVENIHAENMGRGMVIHAKGRDVGVVVEGINQGGSGYWHKCGRCKLLYK